MRAKTSTSLILLIFLAMVAGYYILSGMNQPKETKTFKAKLVTESVFEKDIPWVIGRFSYQPFVRLIYEIPINQIPLEASYVWVRIEIPDATIDKLRNLWNSVKQGNEEWFESFAFPQIAYAKKLGYQNWDIYPIKAVSIINKTQDGYPKVIDVKIWKVGNEWYKYLIVAFPSPFFEGFEEWKKVSLDTENSPYKGWYFDYRSDSGTSVWIQVYGDNDKSDSKALRFPGGKKWAIIYKDINIPIQSDKDIPIAIGFCRGGTGDSSDKAHAIVLELEKKDSTTYKVGIILHNGDNIPNYADIAKNKLEIDCILHDFKSYADWWCENRHYSLKEIIEKYCANINWTDLARIKRIYLAGTREYGGTNDINFIWIGDPRVYTQ